MKRILRKLRYYARLGPPPLVLPATGPIDVTSRHLSPAVAATVNAWFQGEIGEFQLSGERSVIIAHPERPQMRLKIKGAGLRGAPLAFTRRHKSGLVAPRFDFDGRLMPDVASSHDNTYFGGASFQQTAVEYAISARLAALGYGVVPCLGHGQVTRQGRASWFSVFELDPAWRSYTLPDFTILQHSDRTMAFGADVVELATRHGLIGYFWYVADQAGGPALIKDVHPFIGADPITMSQLSWVLQVFFALHIVALTTVLQPKLVNAPDRPANAQARIFHSFCPDARPEDHDALRWSLVAPYMLTTPKEFDPRALDAVLKGNRITAALMERCPPEFARL